MGILEDLAIKLSRSGKQNQHQRSSSQMDPVYQQLIETNERYNPRLGLEAPLLDPLDPFMLPKTLPSLLAKGAKGYGKLAAEVVERGVQSGHPAMAAVAPLSIIKAKGGNWLTGSVEKALEGLKLGPNQFSERKYGQSDIDEILKAINDPNTPEVVKKVAREEAKTMIPKATINKWIEGPLTKYVKRDMATEGDPVRKLAEQGILHVSPEQLNIPGERSPLMDLTFRGRADAGFPREGVATSPIAKSWETVSDSAVGPAYNKNDFGTETMAKNPWVAKLGEGDKIHDLNSGYVSRDARELGLNHLIDELSNALNPESGLPRHLLLNPEDFQQMGMERAVRHVDAINKWRAAQKAEADAIRANNAATVLHKEYPENNPLGLRWVELKAPDRLPDEAAKEEFGDIGRYAQAKLRDALKYEGDTMGHCVGGYCDDVLSGRSRIYSLRDAKGQPHVTIETQHLPVDKMTDADVAALARSGIYGEPDPRIVQIKGKQNRAPNPEYLPFVQDFVKSGKWSDVGDIGNTGLRRSRDVWNDMERKRIQEAGHEIPEFTTMDDIKAINSKVWPGDDVYNFAEGGLVTNYKRALPESGTPAIISNYQP